MTASVTISLPALLACGLALAFASTPAAQASAGHSQNGAGACDAALPAFEGAIRKRPLAIQNEGSAPAFISCASVAGRVSGTSSRVTRMVIVGLVNNAAETLTVTCTLVDGIANLEPPNHMTQSREIAPGRAAEFVWTTSGASTQAWQMGPGMSCLLPIGTGVSYMSAYE